MKGEAGLAGETAEHPDSVEYPGAVRATSRFSRGVFIGLGTLSLGTGILGIFLPVLPTTPFLLLAAACYARGSERLYRWLLGNRVFGRYIREWRREPGIPLRMKLAVFAMIVLAAGLSAAFGVDALGMRALILALGTGGILYVGFRVPTRTRS